MEPKFITATEWYWVASFVEAILWFALLGVVAGLSFLTAHAVIPSLIMTRQLVLEARLLQFGAYAASLAALAVALYSLSLALGYAFAVIDRVFPRWGI